MATAVATVPTTATATAATTAAPALAPTSFYMMTKRNAAELCSRLEQRRVELEKARAELGLVNGDTLEAYEQRTAAALKRYNEVVLPPLREQVMQMVKRCPPPPPPPAVPAATTTTATGASPRVTELKEKLAQVDKRLAQLEKEQSVRDVAMDAVQALDEKAELEKALAEAEKQQQSQQQAQQPTQQSQTNSEAVVIPEATRFAVERWVAARLTALEQDAARGCLAEPSAASFAAPSNADLPTFKDLALVKAEPAAKPTSTAGLEKIFE